MRVAPGRVGFWALAPLGVLALVAGCPDRSRLKGKGCEKDVDCGEPAEAFLCEKETGACYCRDDRACSPREFCNTAGFCQDRSGCEKNSDCLGSGLFCDTTTGSCLSEGRCSIDLHCPLGKVCDVGRAVCVDGCRTSGDCFGSSCRCGEQPCVCDGVTREQVSRCAIGVCDPAYCASDSFCQFGEVCGVPDGGVGLNQCFSDYDPNARPYCDNCSSGGGLSRCGTGTNYCLIDTAHPGNFFCGVDCSTGQSCPRGYRCSDVIVVFTQWKCSAQAPVCPANPAYPCTQDSDCPRGGTCAKGPGQVAGSCAGKCAIDEGEPEGFCSCLVDSDCAQETCGIGGECSISGKPCITDQDCRTIHCVDFQGAGGCLIGQNCAPSEGLTCLEVR